MLQAGLRRRSSIVAGQTEPHHRGIKVVKHLNRAMFLLVNLHKAPQTGNRRFGQNKCSLRSRGESAARRNRASLSSGQLQLRNVGRVDQLIESGIERRIAQEAILIFLDLRERDAAHWGRDDQAYRVIEDVIDRQSPAPLCN